MGLISIILIASLTQAWTWQGFTVEPPQADTVMLCCPIMWSHVATDHLEYGLSNVGCAKNVKYTPDVEERMKKNVKYFDSF